MSNRRPYVRSMDDRWKRDPYFVRYMAREVTAVFVAAYAVVLLVGLVRLSQGEAAFNAWLQALKSPLSLVFHLILLATFVYHTWNWFNIMPKTMPMMFVGGKRVQPGAITGTGLAASVVACLAVFFIVLGMN
ncbi:MAG: fumarate reductase subunit C [Pseudomonadota bacterium]